LNTRKRRCPKVTRRVDVLIILHVQTRGCTRLNHRKVLVRHGTQE